MYPVHIVQTAFQQAVEVFELTKSPRGMSLGMLTATLESICGADLVYLVAYKAFTLNSKIIRAWVNRG